MTYDYDVYYRQDCIVPIILVLFCSALTIRVGFSLWKKGAGGNTWLYVKENLLQWIFIVWVMFLIIVNSIHLFRGGIYLLFEKESHAVQVTGTIEKTVELDALTGSKYDAEQNHGRGVAVVINGEKYFMTTYGDFKVGDDVVLKILPHSHFVMEMEYVSK